MTYTEIKAKAAKIKAKHPDCVLLFRVGDEYQMFDSDTEVGSKCLGLEVTIHSDGVFSEKTLKCAFSLNRLDVFLPKIIRKGYRVAICELG